jgi:hypothetical protein
MATRMTRRSTSADYVVPPGELRFRLYDFFDCERMEREEAARYTDAYYLREYPIALRAYQAAARGDNHNEWDRLEWLMDEMRRRGLVMLVPSDLTPP